LAEDQARGLYSFHRRNLSAELERLHERVARVEDDHIVEAEQLSRSVQDISNALVDLYVLFIQDIPSQL
jgi:rubrerythrin